MRWKILTCFFPPFNLANLCFYRKSGGNDRFLLCWYIVSLDVCMHIMMYACCKITSKKINIEDCARLDCELEASAGGT